MAIEIVSFPIKTSIHTGFSSQPCLSTSHVGEPPCRIAWRENLQEGPLDLPLNQPSDLWKMILCIFVICSHLRTQLYNQGIDIGNAGNTVFFLGGVVLKQIQVQWAVEVMTLSLRMGPRIILTTHVTRVLHVSRSTVRHLVPNLGVKIYQPYFFLHDQCKVWHTLW